MKIFPIKTEIIRANKKTLFDILDRYLPSKLEERSIVVITSMIVSLCEGSVVPLGKIDKKELVKKEVDYYIPSSIHKENIGVTIKNNMMIFSGGIDESNGGGYFVLWPRKPQKTANEVRRYLRARYKLKNIGVLITDSRIIPLRWGTVGVTLAHSGFKALKDYTGKRDLFSRKFEFEIANIADALAAAAVAVIGEGAEQTPLAIIEDIAFVEFNQKDPSSSELSKLHVGLKDPIFQALFKNVPWRKGG
ncbi:MAG: coenzyme F420-0:L-glutamate ligase [Candidatus Nealsonbacteria bacterium]|nr:coenzyme F420-0:L-glutamate ligase [Candidatus Nealsonbacteria bacterium]